MNRLLERLRSQRTITTGIITQTGIGLSIVIILLINFELESPIIETWSPYLLIYLAYLIAISPLLSRFTSESDSNVRKKFLTAREELIKAQKCAKENPEDVMIHVRGAIDLSIKEKFGFKKIQPMLKFLKDANEYDFPLPSYDLIYRYFDVGSTRLHSGTLNTPFEVSQITRTVSDFLNALERITIPQKKIEDFRAKCKWIE